MKKGGKKKPVENALRRLYQEAAPRPKAALPDAPPPHTIDLSGPSPRFSWLSEDDQANFNMWMAIWSKRGRFKDWGVEHLAAFTDYIEWSLEREIGLLELELQLSEQERAERREAREQQVARALARGPLRRKVEKTVLVELHAKEWRAHAKEAWQSQLEARRNGERIRPLDTYAEIARDIQRRHDGKPRPTVTTIRQAIAGLRPTLSGRSRKNANVKKRSE